MVVLSLTKPDLSMNGALSIAGSPVYDISNRAYEKGLFRWDILFRTGLTLVVFGQKIRSDLRADGLACMC